MVRFRYVDMFLYKIQHLVSIPLWFDSDPDVRSVTKLSSMVSIPLWFDSDSESKRLGKLSDIQSQFHYGSIQMLTASFIRRRSRKSLNSTMVRFRSYIFRLLSRPLRVVSIPLWFDSDLGDFKSPHTCLAWSQFHYGSIQIGLIIQ